MSNAESVTHNSRLSATAWGGESTATPGDPARNQRTYPLFDILRFGAALLVMLSHLRDQFFAPYSETRSGSALFKAVFFFATRLGLESVVLFFVLSGFLVGGISVDKWRKGAFRPGNTPSTD